MFSLLGANRAERPGWTHPPDPSPSGSFCRVFPRFSSQLHNWPHWLNHAWSLVVPQLTPFKNLHLGESDWTFPVSPQAPGATLSSQLPARLRPLINPAHPTIASFSDRPSSFVFSASFSPQHRPFHKQLQEPEQSRNHSLLCAAH